MFATAGEHEQSGVWMMQADSEVSAEATQVAEAETNNAASFIKCSEVI